MKMKMKMKRFVHNNKNLLLTTIAAIGVVGTAFVSAKNTVKYIKLREQYNTTKSEAFIKSYMSTIITVSITISAILVNHHLNVKQQKAILSAYLALDNSFKQYKAKFIEKYGEEKEKELRESIIEDEIKKYKKQNPHSNEVITFYCEFSERYFESTMEKVLSAQTDINKIFVTRGYATVNDFFNLLGLEPEEAGDYYEWSTWSEDYSWIDFINTKCTINDDLDYVSIRAPFAPILTEE